MIKINCFILGFTLIFLSCKSNNDKKDESELYVNNILHQRYEKLLDYPLDSLGFPRSFSRNKNTLKKVTSKDWTSGFFPGNLWQIYHLTGNKKYRKLAEKWTAFVEKEKFNGGTHDMGFKLLSSYGNGLKSVKNKKKYQDVIVKGAQTLSTRFDENIGSIRSWDFNIDIWQFPVIIDNMMNLELLFEATKITGDSTYHKIAVKHANTTLKNHFRDDGSTWHVVDYDTITKKVRTKFTHQGIADNSAWARGQAWAVHGYTMAYRYTKDVKYLNRAKRTAHYFINHKDLPEDGIAYWDFNDPKIPHASRDVSASVIIASALVELYGYTSQEEYLNYSKKVINSIKNISNTYILPQDENIPFILDHNYGDWSKRAEMDEPIVYGDYYFLQTLLRLKKLQS